MRIEFVQRAAKLRVSRRAGAERMKKDFFPASHYSLLVSPLIFINLTFPVARRISGTKTDCLQSRVHVAGPKKLRDLPA